MIRAIVIYDSRDHEIFYTTYANFALNLPFVSNSILSIKDLLARRFEDIIIGRYRIGFLFEPDYSVLILADRSNKESELYEVGTMINNALISVFGENISEDAFEDPSKRDEFEDKLEEIIRNALTIKAVRIK